MIYSIYIKSHCEAPDYERDIDVDSEKEAVEVFYYLLKGEFDREFIQEHMAVIQ